MLPYLAEEERKEFLNEAEEDFKKMLSEQKSGPDDLFSIQGFRDGWNEVMRPNRFSMFYSTEQFLDSCTIILTLALGIYTFCLMYSTISYVRR